LGRSADLSGRRPPDAAEGTGLIERPPRTIPGRVAKQRRRDPIGRSGQPNEVAPCYVFSATADASYIGPGLHPNGVPVVGS
jgi:NAD(P)-dependent dehydrogenase (short-subunit alcohol dehydrogenase family)